jgi:LysR family transcriptional regulator of gallate degradation
MLLKTFNIRHLRVFIEVVKYKSISRASEKVFLSQPAITQAIAKLEVILNTSLFDRCNDGMFVTKSGKVFALRLQRAIDILLSGLKDTIRFRGTKGSQPSYLLKILTTTQLRALIAVSDAQNFSIASRNLNVSQSSLHRAARELESLLEVVLFEKTSTGITLSKAAIVLTKASKLAFSEIAQGQDEINSIDDQEIGQIVIGSMPFARTSVLPDTIIKFSDQFPYFKIKVNDGPYDDLLNYLRQGDIDVLIGALRFPVLAGDVIQKEIFTSPVEVVARTNHPLCRVDHVAIEELKEYPWVIPKIGTPTRTVFESVFNEKGIGTPQRLIETGSQILIRGLLLGSDRLTMISKHQIQHELDMNILKLIPYKLDNHFRAIGVTVRRGWKPTATQIVFINMLSANDGYIDIDEQ